MIINISIMLNIILVSVVLLSLTCTSEALDESSSVLVPPSCSPCQCLNNGDGQIKANCSSRRLDSVPLNLPPNVVDIDLENNAIFSYNSNSGICDKYKSLQKISLAQNELMEVHTIFKGCEALEELVLTGNTLAPDSLEKAFLNLQGLIALKGLTVSGLLKREIFSPLKKLKHVELSYDGLSFPNDLFADLADLRSLHLNLVKSLKIDQAPLETNSLEELYLNGPKITTLPATFFSNLASLTTLDLDLPQLNNLKWPDQQLFSSLKHLSIKSVWLVDTDTLSGMRSLQTLQLAGIDTLVEDRDMFAHQKNLEVLEITDCDLKRLQASWLVKLESLCDLSLINNKLEDLDPNALDGLSNLRNIVLSFNRITEIPRGFFNPVADKLENLILNENMLTAVQRDVFPRMNNLMALDISKNSLLEFDLSISQQMPDLIYLQLQENMITNLTGSLGSKVQRVNIAYNNFENVPDGLLVESLIGLDLSGNLVTLPVNEIMSHKNLKELTIKGMTVKCDCAMQQLIKSKVVHGGECESEMNRRGVVDILNESLCEDTTSTTVSIIDALLQQRNTSVTTMDTHLNLLYGNGFESVGDSNNIFIESEHNETQINDIDVTDPTVPTTDNLLQQATITVTTSVATTETFFIDSNNISIESEHTETQVSDINVTDATVPLIDNLLQPITPVTTSVTMETPLNVYGYESVGNSNKNISMDSEHNETPVNYINVTDATVPIIDNLLQPTNSIVTTMETTLNHSDFNQYESVVDANKDITVENEHNETRVYDFSVTVATNANITAPVAMDVEKTETYEEKMANETLSSNSVINKTEKTMGAHTGDVSHDGHDKNCTMLTQEIPGNGTTSYEERAMTNHTILETPSLPNVSKSANPSSKDPVKGRPVSEENHDMDVIVFPIISILVIILIVAVVLMLWHVRRTGSHSLDHDRRNIANEDSNSCKMVMTELGKTHPGQQVIVM